MHTEEQKHLWQKIERKRLSFEGWAVRRVRSSLRESLKRVIEDVRISPQTAISRLEEDVTTAPIGEAIEDIFLRVGTDFAEQVQRSFTKSVLRDYWIEKMRLLAEDRKAVVMVGIGEESKRSIRNAIAKGVEAGEGQNEIIGRIRDSYAMNNARARMIARTEIVAASNQGALVGAQSAGIPLKKEWIATLDERTRADHLEMNGTIIEMNENFMVAGEQMSAPADWQFGASAWNVINCRCAVAFVTADSEIMIEDSDSPIGVDGLPKTRDIKELDKLIKEINPNIDTKIPSTANPDIVREHYRAINWFEKQSGGIKTKFYYEYSVKKANVRGGMYGYFDPNPVNASGKRSVTGEFVPQNVKMISFSDKNLFEERLKNLGERGWFPKGTTVESVMAHELTHYVDLLGGLKKSGYISGVRNGRAVLNRSTNPNYSVYVRNHRSSNELMNQMYQSFGVNADLQNDPKLAGQIRSQMARIRSESVKLFGDYARQDPAEFVAMAVQYEYMYPGQNEVAKRITQLLFKRYKEAFL